MKFFRKKPLQWKDVRTFVSTIIRRSDAGGYAITDGICGYGVWKRGRKIGEDQDLDMALQEAEDHWEKSSEPGWEEVELCPACWSLSMYSAKCLDCSESGVVEVK